MRRSLTSLRTLIQGYFTSGSDQWGGQEVEDSLVDILDSIGAAYVALTDGATITWDIVAGNIASVTLAGNRTLSITNLPNPGAGVLYVTQDGTGSRTLTLPAGSQKPAGFSLSTGAGKKDALGWINANGVLIWSIEKDIS